MAAWQTDFSLQPELRALPEDFRAQLDALLPRGRTWHEWQEAWGAEDGNRVEVWHDPRGATEVVIRVDLRELDPAWLEQLLAFARHVRRELWTPDGRVFGANLGELTLVLRGSPAWRFVREPEAYLRRVRLGGYKDA
jgi:hypothetical protein